MSRPSRRKKATRKKSPARATRKPSSAPHSGFPEAPPATAAPLRRLAPFPEEQEPAFDAGPGEEIAPVRPRPRLIDRFPGAEHLKEWVEGRAAFENGCVEFDPETDLVDTFLFASVQAEGGERFDVEIDWSTLPRDFNGPGVVAALCTCEAFRRGALCAHGWGAIHALDAGGPEAVPGRGPLVLVREDGSGGWNLVEEGPERVNELLEEQMRGPAPAASLPTESQDWFRAVAQSVARRSSSGRAEPTTVPAPKQDREAWYVLDTERMHAIEKLAIRVCTRTRLKNGRWSALQTGRPRGAVIASLADPADRDAIAMLLGLESGFGLEWRWGATATDGSIVVPGESHASVLERLAATGRLAFARGKVTSDSNPEHWQILACDPAAAWQFRLDFLAGAKPGAWELHGRLYRSGAEIDVSEPAAVFACGLLVHDGRIANVETDGCFEWIDQFRRRGPLGMTRAEQDKVLSQISMMRAVPPVRLPEEFGWTSSTGTPQLRVEVTAPGDERSTAVRASLMLRYGEVLVDPRSEARMLVDAAQKTWVSRDLRRELALRDSLTTASEAGGARVSAFDPWELLVPRAALGDVLRAFVAAGHEVVADGSALRQPGKWQFGVSSGIDWFDLHGRVEFGEVAVDLADVLGALRRRDAFIKLGDGTNGVLPEAWIERFAPLVALGHEAGGGLRFTSGQGALLDALLVDQQVEVDVIFARLRERLRSFSGIAPLAAPPQFVGELRDYQRHGLGWLEFLIDFGFGGCLADDMGLGKTVQVLALLAGRHANGTARMPSLVVAPRSLVYNWMDEAGRFAPQLRLFDMTGQARHQKRSDMKSYDLVLTTYGTLRRDAHLLASLEFDHVILDEAQAIKNPASVSAKACRVLRAKHRLALTGTPVENHIGELWSIFEFLNPGMLGASGAFRSLGTGPGNLAGAVVPGDDSNAAELAPLRRALRPFVLRRTKEQVLSELPPKTEQTMFCEMEPAQRKFYDDLRNQVRATVSQRIESQGFAKSKIHVLEALLRLRQAACDPQLVDVRKTSTGSCKLDALEEQLQEVIDGGHRALVFSQFTSLLAIVCSRLDKLKIRYQYLDGQTRDRKERVEAFQNDPSFPVFLISLKAGGQGLNLTGADYVFILDPWWNPAVEAQAIDRTHRIGQTRHVFAYRLIARGTVEDKILELQARKRDLADAILKEDASPLARLTADDLRLLLE